MILGTREPRGLRAQVPLEPRGAQRQRPRHLFRRFRPGTPGASAARTRRVADGQRQRHRGERRLDGRGDRGGGEEGRLAGEADDYLVFVISDANLGSYGITPEMLRRVLTADPKVTACAIFIAERGAADMLSAALPAGRGYVCLDVERLPSILKDVFARAAVGG
ncbi:unnamed protein product [Prorocentrum cordatum]|uniref:Uncharacterized protein n=1 Tax=Prorocentrum cordatum TaxID=2364126 RepID=A0ABN9TGH7_9DINO|nr:unnamed protein product [Polarella glacialis]